MERSSTGPPGGNQVDGLPPACSFSELFLVLFSNTWLLKLCSKQSLEAIAGIVSEALPQAVPEAVSEAVAAAVSKRF